MTEEVLTLGELATWPVLILDKFRRMVGVAGSRLRGIIGSGYLRNMIYSLAITLNIQALEMS